MTSRKSYVDDNGGRCEACNREDTVFQRQSTIRVYLGGGLGPGTMWVCDVCRPVCLKRQLLHGLLERIAVRGRR